MKKTIYGLILAVFFGIYIFFGNEFGGVNAKALTIDDIQTANDLRGTSWVLNETLTVSDSLKGSLDLNSNIVTTNSEFYGLGSYNYGEGIIELCAYRQGNVLYPPITAGYSIFAYSVRLTTSEYVNSGDLFGQVIAERSSGTTYEFTEFYGNYPRNLRFDDWEDDLLIDNGFIAWLKANATFGEPQPPEYTVTIVWPILEESMILISGETVTINFDELMQTYKNYEYVDLTWSYNDNGIGDITLPLYFKLLGFDASLTGDFETTLFINSGTYTFSQDIYLRAVSEEPRNWIFTKFSYIDDSLEGSVEDGYNLLIPFSDNEVNINWTYDDDMIVDITGLEGFKIAISRFDETSIDIIEYTYSSPHSIQFYINKLGYYFNKVEANAYRYWYNTNTSPWEPPYLNDSYKFNPQEDIEYYDLTNRSANISVYDDEPTAILYITQEVNYNYEGGGNEGDQLNGAMITFFSLITGLINLKFGFISIGGILAILFGVALLTFIFKIWNGNNNG